LFVDGTQLADDAVMGNIAIPANGLEFRVIDGTGNC
jgi:hypothetical protein